MQIIASDDNFDFCKRLEDERKEYYSEHPESLDKRLEKMYVPSGARRPIIRTLDIINDVKKICGNPAKIFVEMARGADEGDKERKKSRKEQLNEYYDAFNGEYKNEISMLRDQLESSEERVLASDKIFLYFIQLGKCMYSGEPIDLDQMLSNDNLYDIDHIYPRCDIKDDSLSNRVLVKSEFNGNKGDKYPIDPEIQRKMGGFWKSLTNKKLVSDEKYRRLTRTTGFDFNERMGFINRQLVETRQSTKAVAQLLKEAFPESEIVYVKAGLVSDFREKFDLLKSRTVNDLHHAKDAYLNIVVGNVYSKFTSEWFKKRLKEENEKYSMKTVTMFSHPQYIMNERVWDGKKSIDKVKKIVSKNNIHLTKYALCKKGELFKQNPLKAGDGQLVPRKSWLDASKYGGYTKTTASFFVLVRYIKSQKTEVSLVPVELMYAEKFLSDKSFTVGYVTSFLKQGKAISDISFPLGFRPIKIGATFEVNNSRFILTGKANGGAKVITAPFVSLKLESNMETYVKKIEKFVEKYSQNKNIRLSECHDKITAAENERLYEVYVKKANSKLFSDILPTDTGKLLSDRHEYFGKLSIEEQVIVLYNIGIIFKTGNKGGYDLSLLDKMKLNRFSLSANLSNWQKKYSEVYLINNSASGLFESRSCNLLNLLK